MLSDIFFCIYLENISVAGRGLDDAQSPELSPHQRQHAAVDVIQADAWRAQGQAGALHLKNGLVQLSLGCAEPATEGGEEQHAVGQWRQKLQQRGDERLCGGTVSSLLSINWPRAGDVADVAEILTTAVE